MNASKTQPYFLFALLLGVALLAFFIFRPFLIPLSLAAIFAAVLYPLNVKFLAIFKASKGLSALLTLIISVSFIAFPLYFIGSSVMTQAESTYVGMTQAGGQQTVRSIVLTIGSTLEGIVPGATRISENVARDVNSYISSALSWILAHVGTVFSSALALGLDLFIFLFALYYFLKEGPKVRKAIVSISPFNDTDDEQIIERLSRTVNSVVKGSMLVAVVQGVIAGIGFTLFGVPNALLWGTVTAFAALIPGVGTSLVLVPSIIYLFITGNSAGGVGLVVWGVLAVGLVDNFLGPKVMGRGIHMHQLVVLLAVLGGVAFFGPAGIFLGPLAISLLIALFSIYSDGIRRA